MSKVVDSIAELLVNMICNHPKWVVGLLAVFVFATLVNSGIKGTWAFADMPRWARFVLGFTMPLALNFYHIGKIQPPSSDGGGS